MLIQPIELIKHGIGNVYINEQSCTRPWPCLSLVKLKNSSYFRQLEAVVRIAESLAKMKLQAVAGEEEVDEALRLFQVSTLDAALSGNLSGVCCCC